MDQHTQFLDLTNGEGGEHPFEYEEEEEEAAGGPPVAAAAPPADEEGEMQDDDDGDDDDDYHHTTSASTAHTVNPNTPGKVVESGQEQTGRWTREEHEAFLEALKLYGKEWKKVAAKVKTRTVVQTRTHAQKYFQKLQKVQEDIGGDVEQVDMGVPAADRKPPSAKKKKPTPFKPGRRSSSTTLSAAQVMANFNQRPGPSVVFSTPSLAPAVTGVPPRSTVRAGPEGEPPRHGFSSHDWKTKITAPDPSLAGFPEPSPAATGKRKLAEIAAARMLAGVASSTTTAVPRDDAPTPPPPLDGAATPPPPPLGAEPARKGLSLQIVNPDTLGVAVEKRRRSGESSPVTPWDGQMEELLNEKAKAAPSTASASSSTMMDMPMPALPSMMATPEHAVVGPAKAYGRSPLHQAICDMDIESLQTLIASSSYLMSQRDDAGFAPLHSACALRLKHPDHSVAAMELAKLLIQSGADVAIVDRKGNTALHWAARAGDREVAEMLLLQSCPMEGRNQDGETALHWGMRAGIVGYDVVALLLMNGARDNAANLKFRRPIDVAAEGFMDDEHSITFLRARDAKNHPKKCSKELKSALKYKTQEMRDCRKNLLLKSAHSRTLVLHHPECLEHVPKSKNDWEAPDRVITILEHLASSMEGSTARPAVLSHEVTLSTEFERAKLDLLKRVHGAEYLSFVHDLSKDLEKKIKGSQDGEESDSPAPVVPFTPMVQRSMIKINEQHVKLGINSDTAFSAGSLRAARRAAGAVQHAVDWYVPETWVSKRSYNDSIFYVDISHFPP